jgi:hypothetical protein
MASTPVGKMRDPVAVVGLMMRTLRETGHQKIGALVESGYRDIFTVVQ